MSWHKIRLNDGKEIQLKPINIKRTDSGNIIIGMVKLNENYSRISIDCTKITHVDDFEIFSIYLVRPLSIKLNDFTKQSLRITLDHNDFITSMGVIKP
jgi:hypothetical protein